MCSIEIHKMKNRATLSIWRLIIKNVSALFVIESVPCSHGQGDSEWFGNRSKAFLELDVFSIEKNWKKKKIQMAPPARERHSFMFL